MMCFRWGIWKAARRETWWENSAVEKNPFGVHPNAYKKSDFLSVQLKRCEGNMKKITIIFLLGVVAAGSINCISTRAKNNVKGGFVLFEDVPVFEEGKKALIKEHFCKIFENLKEPEKFYIKDIHEISEGFAVVLYPLVMLQSGGNSKGTQINFVSGESFKILFSKNWELIRIEEQ